MTEKGLSVPIFKPPKAWRKLTPDTIEAWLVSDDPDQRRLADEALARLGPDAAQTYLERLLVLERDTILRRIRIVSIAVLIPFAALFVANFLTRNYLFYLAGIAGTMTATFASISFRQTTTKLQKRIVEWALDKNDVHFIGILLKSFSTVPSIAVNTTVRDQLPFLMKQITPANKYLVPKELWEQFVHSLEAMADQKNIRYIFVEQEFALAHIQICGNARYAPALPALRKIAERDVTTSQARELRELAASYVADWDLPIASTHVAFPTFPETFQEPVRLAGR